MVSVPPDGLAGQDQLPGRQAALMEQQYSRRVVAVSIELPHVLRAVIARGGAGVDAQDAGPDDAEGPAELAEGRILGRPLHTRGIAAGGIDRIGIYEFDRRRAEHLQGAGQQPSCRMMSDFGPSLGLERLAVRAPESPLGG